jgi:hypothetical protein
MLILRSVILLRVVGGVLHECIPDLLVYSH